MLPNVAKYHVSNVFASLHFEGNVCKLLAKNIVDCFGSVLFSFDKVRVDINDHLLIISQEPCYLFRGDGRYLIAEFRAVVVTERVGGQLCDRLHRVPVEWFVSQGDIHGADYRFPHPSVSDSGHHLVIIGMKQESVGT